MLNSLMIENFRCFKKFELKQIGQVNLFVGENNSGKTSILESIQLLKSKSKILEVLRSTMSERGEYIINDDASLTRELNICHLFYGHQISQNQKISISSTNSGALEGINISIAESEQQSLRLFEEFKDLVLVIDWFSSNELISDEDQTQSRNTNPLRIPLSASEGLVLDDRIRTNRLVGVRRKDLYGDIQDTPQFVKSSSLSPKETIELFERVVLTPEEDLVIQALRIIEPNIDRIASVSSSRLRSISSRDGFVMKLLNTNQRVPIGSMGDGIWRILGLALAIINARNGVLLIDEIDTGLHFSTMSSMWKMIWETAKRLNVQVFATTHSSDCWKSLAEIVGTESPSKEGITIHRIEKDKSSSVLFTERQIVIAAEREIEVR